MKSTISLILMSFSYLKKCILTKRSQKGEYLWSLKMYPIINLLAVGDRFMKFCDKTNSIHNV